MSSARILMLVVIGLALATTPTVAQSGGRGGGGRGGRLILIF